MACSTSNSNQFNKLSTQDIIEHLSNKLSPTTIDRNEPRIHTRPPRYDYGQRNRIKTDLQWNDLRKGDENAINKLSIHTNVVYDRGIALPVLSTGRYVKQDSQHPMTTEHGTIVPAKNDPHRVPGRFEYWSDDEVHFFTKKSIFSNMHPTVVTHVYGDLQCTFTSVEHLYNTIFRLYMEGTLDGGDNNRKLLTHLGREMSCQSKTPSDMKNWKRHYISTNIKNSEFRHRLKEWNLEKKNVLAMCVLVRASRDKRFRDALRKTEGRQIFEASLDEFWGTGVSVEYAHHYQGRGHNHMGNILMDIRSYVDKFFYDYSWFTITDKGYRCTTTSRYFDPDRTEYGILRQFFDPEDPFTHLWYKVEHKGVIFGQLGYAGPPLYALIASYNEEVDANGGKGKWIPLDERETDSEEEYELPRNSNRDGRMLPAKKDPLVKALARVPEQQARVISRQVKKLSRNRKMDLGHSNSWKKNDDGSGDFWRGMRYESLFDSLISSAIEGPKKDITDVIDKYWMKFEEATKDFIAELKTILVALALMVLVFSLYQSGYLSGKVATGTVLTGVIMYKFYKDPRMIPQVLLDAGAYALEVCAETANHWNVLMHRLRGKRPYAPPSPDGFQWTQNSDAVPAQELREGTRYETLDAPSIFYSLHALIPSCFSVAKETVPHFAQETLKILRNISSIKAGMSALFSLAMLAVNWFTSRDLDSLPGGSSFQKELTDWIKKTEEHCFTVFYPRVMGDQTASRQVYNHFQKGVELRQRLHATQQQDSPTGKLFEKTYTRYLTLFDVAVRVLADEGSRAIPTTVLLPGGPGIGKTAFLKRLLIDACHKLQPGENINESKIYVRNPRDEFWSKYAGQPITFIDDISGVATSEAQEKEWSEFQNLVGDTTHQLNMAHLQDKGLEFTSRLIGVTTNIQWASVHTALSSTTSFASSFGNLRSPHAIYRRMHFTVRLRIANEFKLPDGRLDTDKAKGRDLNDIFTIDVDYIASNGMFMSKTMQYEELVDAIVEHNREAEICHIERRRELATRKNPEMKYLPITAEMDAAFERILHDNWKMLKSFMHGMVPFHPDVSVWRHHIRKELASRGLPIWTDIKGYLNRIHAEINSVCKSSEEEDEVRQAAISFFHSMNENTQSELADKMGVQKESLNITPQQFRESRAFLPSIKLHLNVLNKPLPPINPMLKAALVGFTAIASLYAVYSIFKEEGPSREEQLKQLVANGWSEEEAEAILSACPCDMCSSGGFVTKVLSTPLPPTESYNARMPRMRRTIGKMRTRTLKKVAGEATLIGQSNHVFSKYTHTIPQRWLDNAVCITMRTDDGQSGLGQGYMLNNRVLATAKHVVLPDVVSFKITTNESTAYFSRDDYSVFSFSEVSDAAYVVFKTPLQGFVDMTKQMMTEEECESALFNLSSTSPLPVQRVKCVDNVFTVSCGSAFAATIIDEDWDDCEWPGAAAVVNYSADSAPGDSGSAVFLTFTHNGNKLVRFAGCHLGAHSTGTRFFSLMLRSDVDQLGVQKECFFSDTQDAYSNYYYVDPTFSMCKDPKIEEHQENNNFTYAKINPLLAPRMQAKTKFKRSKIADDLVSYGYGKYDVKAPARLRSKEASVAIPAALSKLRMTNIHECQHFEKAAQHLEQELVDLFSKYEFKRTGTTFEQSYRGKPNHRYYQHIDRTTSPGLPITSMGNKHKKTKDELFGCPNEPLKEEGREMINNILRDLLSGRDVRAHFTAVDTLKDELRAMDKVDSPRVFSVMPVAANCIIRAFFGDFIEAYLHTRSFHEARVGINPYDHQQWAEALYYLGGENYKTERYLALDFKAFDKTCSKEVIARALHVMKNVFSHFAVQDPEGDFPVEGAQYEIAINSLISALSNVPHILVDTMYVPDGSNPSGNALTVILNSLINSIYQRTAFFALAEDGQKFPRCLIYGDDLVLHCKYEFQNYTTIAEFFKRYGINVQPAIKGGIVQEVQTVDDITFLKRRWRESSFGMMAPMDFPDIFAHLFWTKSDENLEQEIAAVLLELTQHPNEVAEEHRRNLFKIANSHGLRRLTSTFKHLQSICSSQLFVNYGDVDNVNDGLLATQTSERSIQRSLGPVSLRRGHLETLPQQNDAPCGRISVNKQNLTKQLKQSQFEVGTVNDGYNVDDSATVNISGSFPLLMNDIDAIKQDADVTRIKVEYIQASLAPGGNIANVLSNMSNTLASLITKTDATNAKLDATNTKLDTANSYLSQIVTNTSHGSSGTSNVNITGVSCALFPMCNVGGAAQRFNFSGESEQSLKVLWTGDSFPNDAYVNHYWMPMTELVAPLSVGPADALQDAGDHGHIPTGGDFVISGEGGINAYTMRVSGGTAVSKNNPLKEARFEMMVADDQTNDDQVQLTNYATAPMMTKTIVQDVTPANKVTDIDQSTITNWICRRYEIGQLDWSSTHGLGHIIYSIDPLRSLLSQTILANKLQGIKYITAGVKLTFVVNGTPFLGGRLRAFWVPPNRLHSVQAFPSLTRFSGIDQSVLLHAHQAATVQLDIPCLMPRVGFDLSSTATWASDPTAELVSLGLVAVVVESELVGVSTDPCRISVFAELTNFSYSDAFDASVTTAGIDTTSPAFLVNCAIPTSDVCTARNYVPTPPKKHSRILKEVVHETKKATQPTVEEAQETEAGGILSTTANAVADIAGSVSSILPIAKPIEIVSDAVGGFLSIFGLDKPDERNPPTRTMDKYYDFAHGDGLQQTTHLGLKTNNTVSPIIDGFPMREEDILIKNLCAKPQLIHSRVVGSTDSVNSELIRWSVAPWNVLVSHLTELDTKGTQYTAHSTYASYVAQAFEYWRGDAVVNIHVIAQGFARITLGAVWIPGTTEEKDVYPNHTVPPSFLTNYKSWTMQFQGTGDQTIRIPFNSPELLLNADVQVKKDANVPKATAASVNGTLYIYVIAPPTTIDVNPVNSVDIKTYIGWENLEFSRPTTSELSSFDGGVTFDTNASKKLKEARKEVLYDDIMGETVDTIIDVVRRPSYLGKHVQTEDNANDSVITSVFSAFPMTCQVPSTDCIVNYDNTFDVTPALMSNNYLIYFSRIYLAWRGEVVYSLLNVAFSGNADATLVSDTSAFVMANTVDRTVLAPPDWRYLVGSDVLHATTTAPMTTAIGSGGMVTPVNSPQIPKAVTVPYYNSRLFSLTPDIERVATEARPCFYENLGVPGVRIQSSAAPGTTVPVYAAAGDTFGFAYRYPPAPNSHMIHPGQGAADVQCVGHWS